MKLQERALARKYAQAYIQVYGSRLTQEARNQIERLVAEYMQHKEKFFYLGLSSLAPAVKSNLVFKTCDQFQVRSVLQPLILLLAEQGRLALLVPVLQSVLSLDKELQGIIDVTIQSAQTLDAQQQEFVKKFLEHLTGKKIHARLVDNPELIAGIRVQSDTFLWEHSVAQQLRFLVHEAQRAVGEDV